MRLHIGGTTRREGWTILNIVPGPDIDFVGDCQDLSHLADASVDEIYASHVLEHLDYRHELPRALKECNRILKNTGVFCISVPDMQILCWLFRHPNLSLKARFAIMQKIFGAHVDAHDHHKVGLDYDLLRHYLSQAGFRRVERVESLGVFNDTSEMQMLGVRISLNVRTYKS